MEEVIPEGLIQVNQRDNFLLWLRGLRLASEDKKQLLLLWCDRVGVKTTGDMLKLAGLK